MRAFVGAAAFSLLSPRISGHVIPGTGPAFVGLGLPVLPITEYGAIADNRTINTAAIQRTIDAAAAAGGGLVLAPPGGVFKTGAISLLSGVYLYLPSGATVLGSSDPADYTSISGANWDRWDVLHSTCTNCGLVGDEGGTGTLQGPMWQMISSFNPFEVCFVRSSLNGPCVDAPCACIYAEPASTCAVDEYLWMHRRVSPAPACLRRLCECKRLKRSAA